MKAASKFMSAVSAVALSTSFVTAGAIAVQLAAVQSAEAASVSRIEVRGNRRIDADTIRSQVGIRPGQNFNSSDLDNAVKRLFATGLFSDVSMSQSGGALIVSVSEYAIVNQVQFQGNKKIKNNSLSQSVQLQPRKAFSREMMDADVETIREAYRRIGRDDATVSASVQELDGGRVNVVYTVMEGDRTKIASIQFEGNNAYSDGRLRDVILTKQTNMLSFLSRNDVYDEGRIQADEEALRRFYFNRGYADFRILDARAEVADNKYSIVFTIDEGERYTFGDVSVESSVSGLDVGRIQSEVHSRSGATYKAQDVEKSIVDLTERLAGMGYAFAEVTPRGNRDFANKTISVAYSVDEGIRAYVERIEIRGNNRTRDYVIRREFDVSEGDAFNQVLIQRAKRRLDNLGYFQTINISTVPGSQPDQVVLVVDVVEQSTGEFSIGAGYTTSGSGGGNGGFSLEGSVSERNFLGRGQSIRFSAAGGKDSRDFTFSFTEPYFLGYRMAAGFDIYRNTRDMKNSGGTTIYDRETTGGSVRFGIPITEELTGHLAYNLSQDKYNRVGTDPVSAAVQEAIDQGTWTRSSVSASLVYNTIDNPKDPRSGIHATLATEIAGLGGDAKFFKVTARANYYETLSDDLDLVGLITVGGGHISSWGDDPLRIFDHFNNSDRMIRGFKYNGIGPYQDVVGGGRDYLGGTTYFHATAEAQFPIPVLPESLGIRGAIFADAATLYGNEYNGPGAALGGTSMEWRASVGASLLWASPFGPLRIDYAEPVVKEATDRIQHWNFGISTRF